MRGKRPNHPDGAVHTTDDVVRRVLSFGHTSSDVASELRELAELAAALAPSQEPSPAAAPPQPKPATTLAPDTRHARRERRRAAFLASCAQYGCRPRDFLARHQEGVRAILRSEGGVQPRKFLARLPADLRGPVRAVARSPGDGRELPADLSETWSREVVAAMWLCWSAGRRSKRNGMRRVLDGHTQTMICALFKLGRTRLFGTCYERRPENGGRPGIDTKGIFTALRDAGLLHWQQPRTCDANPRFIGPPRTITLKDGTTTERAFAFNVLHVPDPPS